MKSTRKSIVVMAVVLAVVFAVSSMAMARGYGKGGGCWAGQGSRGPGFDGQGFDCPRFGGPGIGGPGLGAVMGLNLTEDQRDQALKLMETFQIDRIKARGTMIKERENLKKALQADTINEQEIRTAYKKLSSMKEDMLVARAKAMMEMKAILTPEQAKQLNELSTDRFDSNMRGDGRFGRNACGPERSDRVKPQWGCDRSFAAGLYGNCPRQ